MGNPEILPEGAKARRVFLSLRDQITGGQLPDGAQLPGETRLASDYGVSRVTIRRALEALDHSGLIEKRAGSGTTVRHREIKRQPVAMNYNTLMPQLVEMGRKTSAQLLSFAYTRAPDHIAEALQIAPGTEVQVATRVRRADDTHFSHLTTYVPAGIARNYSEDDLAKSPLFALLERSGVQIKAAHQSVSATLAAPEVAQALQVAEGSALLSLRRVVFDDAGQGVEYLAALYRPDMFRLEMPLARVGDGQERHWEPFIGPIDEAMT